MDSYLKILEKNGLIAIKRVFRDRPRVAIRITDKGVKRTREIIDILKKM